MYDRSSNTANLSGTHIGLRLVQLKRSSQPSEARAARYTLNRYSRTSSVSSMLSQLNWQSLVERRRHARLVMFYKIHYQLVSIRIPLTLKFHLQPTRTENIFAYNIPSSSCDYHLYSHSFHELFGTGIRYSIRKSFSWALSKLSDVPFLPSKDCWSAPCICCVGSHCF